MKKFFKILCINFILVIVSFLVLDYITCKILVEKESRNSTKSFHYSPKNVFFNKYNFKKNDNLFFIYNEDFRPIENIHSRRRPIVIFGCSFAYGSYLKQEETLSHHLGELTGRPIYNRALGGWSPKQMVYQLQSKDFYFSVPKPEYVLYVFYPEQVSRLYMNPRLVSNIPKYNLFYKNKNNILVRDKINEHLLSSSLFYLIKRQFYPRQMKHYTQKNLDFLVLHFLTAKEEINKNWGEDIKFVIILYGTSKQLKKLKPAFKVLKNKNFIILNINKLSDKNFNTEEYQIGRSFNPNKYDKHPNAKAWEVITPLIVKKLNL